MAYMNFSEGVFGAAPAAAGSYAVEGAGQPTETGFSALEWLVVALAGRDHLGSLRQPGRIGSALARIFGGRGESRLANPRLEALRRVAVLAWHHGYNVPKSELLAFFETGFTQDQAELLIGNVVSRRAVKRQRRTA